MGLSEQGRARRRGQNTGGRPNACRAPKAVLQARMRLGAAWRIDRIGNGALDVTSRCDTYRGSNRAAPLTFKIRAFAAQRGNCRGVVETVPMHAEKDGACFGRPSGWSRRRCCWLEPTALRRLLDGQRMAGATAGRYVMARSADCSTFRTPRHVAGIE